MFYFENIRKGAIRSVGKLYGNISCDMRARIINRVLPADTRQEFWKLLISQLRFRMATSGGFRGISPIPVILYRK